MAKEIKRVEELTDVMMDFLNGVVEHNTDVYSDAIKTLKDRYELTEEQEAAVRIVLFYLEQFALVPGEEKANYIVGVSTNLLFHVIAGDYGIINRRVLGDMKNTDNK